uniref:Uncharacterized protein LOC105851568 n=1 Tax=Cicer arietinum TaxID=3827 RepID=A0A1S3DY96_CICAR|nr:uncharacterized protein LOC105851568 [Cicer arietinum]
MAEQLDRVDLQVNKSHPSTSSEINSYKDYKLDPKRPIYKLINVPEKELTKAKLKNSSDELIEQLKKLTITNNSQVNVLSQDPEELEINKIKNMKNTGYLGKTRNYYPRPSYPDLQFEESHYMTSAAYSGDSIIEWNIDGHSEQNILNIIQAMTMAATAFKTSGKNTDKKAALLLITGFTGQLKEWWDNIVTGEEKTMILTAVKVDNNGIPIEEDSVNTLLYAITKAFVGDPLQLQERAAEQLVNLHCSSMSDYRWYKDMFMSKLYMRPDGNADYWKERFLAGLPKLFSEKVKMNIKPKFNGIIPYGTLTLGQISNYVVETGIGICTDFKIQNKIRSEAVQSRKELGSFCEQFGIETVRAPSKNMKKRYPKQAFRHYKKKKNYNNNYTPKELTKKTQKIKRTNKKVFNKQEIKCFKCGRLGHYAKNCKVKQKINEISKLEIQKELKENLINILEGIMLIDESSSSSEESSYEEEYVNYISEKSEFEESLEENYCLGPELCNCNDCIKGINMITTDQASTLIEILRKMPNSDQKEEFVIQIQGIIEKEQIARKGNSS